MAYRLKIGARLDKDTRKLLTAQIGRAVGYLAGTIDDSASSIHATRKCLKRSRSILRIVEPALSRKSFRATDRTFRDIARLLSHDRDREVIGDTLAMLSAKAAGGAKAAIGAAIDELDAGSPAPVEIENREEKVALAIARLQACEPVIAALDIRKPGIKTLAQGFAATYGDGRKCLKTACCVNVPSGPRNATLSGSCCARQADMISRNRRRISSSRSGPLLRASAMRSTSASRSGR